MAASTALVCTQIGWVVIWDRFRGIRQPMLVLAGLVLAFAGVLVITGVDLRVSGRALVGDVLALVGALSVASYTVIGSQARRTVSTTTYTFLCYGTAALVLLVAALVAGKPVVGFGGRTWLLLGLVTVTSQLLGHSVFNLLLDTLSPMLVSLALLLEIPGAALLAAALLGQVPPVGRLRRSRPDPGRDGGRGPAWCRTRRGHAGVDLGPTRLSRGTGPDRGPERSRSEDHRRNTRPGSGKRCRECPRLLRSGACWFPAEDIVTRPGRRVSRQPVKEPPVQTQVVILAAGLGTRLGRPHPKPLTPLSSGETIMRRAVNLLRRAWPDARVTAVVGFKLDLVIEAMPDISFVYNEVYDSTNTNKSLLKALRLSPEGGVLWMNGDVVFDARVLDVVEERIAAGQSFVCVDQASVAEEEVKYTLGEDGMIQELSKTVVGGLGEAVGINYVSGSDKESLITRLDECDDQDYFERGIELAIERDGVRFEPVDISEFAVVEVDFDDDLTKANAFVSDQQP